MDTCGKCNREWHSVCNGRVVLPVRVPISNDGGSIMSVCEDCAGMVSFLEIGEIAMEKYIASSNAMPESPSQVSEAKEAIDAWVLRMELGFAS